MKTVDLNADMGEAETPSGQRLETAILGFVSSVNIACGGHAGNTQTMRRTVRAAKRNGVNIGAHPSYPDRAHFGRRSLEMGKDITRRDLRHAFMSQIVTLAEIAADAGAMMTYVKPHGALYNDAVKSRPLSEALVRWIGLIDPDLALMGAPSSEMERAAKNRLKFIAEGFIDRRYTDDGHLQNRSIDGAVITAQSARMEQLGTLITSGHVTTASGTKLAIAAQSLCLHGDSDGALQTAKMARHLITARGVTIKAFVDYV